MKRTPKPMADQIRHAIRRAERQGLTRYRLALTAGISHTTITRFYNGTSQLRLDIAERIASALGGRLRLDI